MSSEDYMNGAYSIVAKMVEPYIFRKVSASRQRFPKGRFGTYAIQRCCRGKVEQGGPVISPTRVFFQNHFIHFLLYGLWTKKTWIYWRNQFLTWNLTAPMSKYSFVSYNSHCTRIFCTGILWEKIWESDQASLSSKNVTRMKSICNDASVFSCLKCILIFFRNDAGAKIFLSIKFAVTLSWNYKLSE